MRARRELRVAVLLCLLGAAVVLLAAGRTWTAVDVPAGPLAGARTARLTGAELVPGVRALGLVGLAGVVALAATRRTGRAVVGVVLLLTGAAVVAAVLAPDLAAATMRAEAVSGRVRTTAWPALTAVGGGLLAAAGVLTAVRGRSWSALGSRYEAPARPATGAATPQSASEPAQSAASQPSPDPQPASQPSPASEPASDSPESAGRLLWEALDRGEDPTANLGTLAGAPADREADRT